jgi:hypothetical protein
MPAQLEPFQDSTSARAELVPFLMAQFQGEGACNTEQWLKRMAYWWDENPFASAHPCRGWVLRDAWQIVGYLGVIPTLYEDPTGKPIATLIATSWAVAEDHRNAALAMGMMLQRQNRSALLVDTTPSPEVQALLNRWGWISQTKIRRSLVIRGTSLACLAGLRNPDLLPLSNGREITTDLSRVQSICASRPQKALQKHITPDYLRWYSQSPMREHHFIGVVDTEGQLSSYLMLTPKPIKGVSSWKVMDWFTTQETNRELLAMLGHLIGKSPANHGNWWPFISLAAFSPQDLWAGVPQAYQREESVQHFYCLPPEYKGQEIRSVMAEGDWGL